MIGSNLISGLALLRMESRDSGAAAETRMEEWLDEIFPDSTLQEYFPKMKAA